MAEIFVTEIVLGKWCISKNERGAGAFCLFCDGVWRYLPKAVDENSPGLYSSQEEAELAAAKAANFVMILARQGSQNKKEKVFSDADRACYALQDFRERFFGSDGLVDGSSSPEWIKVYRAENIGRLVMPVLEWNAPLPVAC